MLMEQPLHRGNTARRRYCRGQDVPAAAAWRSGHDPLVAGGRERAGSAAGTEDRLSGLGDDGQGLGDVLQGLALGVDGEERRDDAAQDHRARAEEVAPVQRVRVLPSPIRWPYRCEPSEPKHCAMAKNTAMA